MGHVVEDIVAAEIVYATARQVGAGSTIISVTNTQMICSVFAYSVDPPERSRFERVYGPDGEWAAFFRGAEGYLGTELLGAGSEYLVIDRWESEPAYDAFLDANAEEYARRNREAAGLWLSERVIGRFSAVR